MLLVDLLLVDLLLVDLLLVDLLLVDLLLDQPRGKLIIAQDGTVNLAQMGKVVAPTAQPPAPTPSAPVPVDAEKKTRVRIDRLQVTGGNVEFSNLSLRPQFGVRISDLAELIVGLFTETIVARCSVGGRQGGRVLTCTTRGQSVPPRRN